MTARSELHVGQRVKTIREHFLPLPFFVAGALSLNLAALLILLLQEFITIQCGALISKVLLLIGCRICDGMRKICLKLYYRYALACVGLALAYYSIFFAPIVVYAIFGEPPSPRMLIGVGIVIAASFIIILPDS